MSQNNVEGASAELEDELSLRMHIPDELQAANYANRVVSSCTPSEFVITFAQVPPLRDSADVDEARAAGYLDTVAVANVAVNHEFLPRIIEIFQMSLNRLKESKSEKEENS